jgi:hypothetical protein
MLELDDASDSERVADWIELELSLGESSFSKSKVSSIARDAGGIEPGESFPSDVWQQLRNRISLYATPFFEVQGDLATRRDDIVTGRLEYEIC